MSLVSIDLEIAVNTASPVLAALIKHLEDATRLHVLMADRTERLTRDYLADLGNTRHATADRLGATPTGILGRAAESPEGTGTRDAVVLTMRPAEVLARAFHDVEIVPRAGKKFLTIPIHRTSYGKRAGEFDDLLFITTRSGAKLLIRRAANGNLIPMFLLVQKVDQKQDRTLLPSDDAYLEEMEAAAEDMLLEIDRKEGLTT